MKRFAPRASVEAALRAAALAALASLILRALLPPAQSVGQVVSQGDLGEALARWTRESRPLSAHVRLDSVPRSVHRAWLGALSRSGSSVSWSGELDPLALSVVAVPDPVPTVDVRVAGARGSVSVADELGELRRLTSDGGAWARVREPRTSIQARWPKGSALVPAPAAPGDTRVLVAGGAGWESKFVIAALEERGWRVDALLEAAPGVAVSGGRSVLDTANYGVVVIVDGVGTRLVGGRAEQFVREGGGLVMTAESAGSAALARFAPGRPAPVPARESAETFTGPRDLAAIRLVRALPAAVPLSDGGPGEVAYAARLGSGRVVVLGYRDTWRWRLQPDAASQSAHREWWSSLISSVAPSRWVAPPRGSDPAPLAHLVEAIGPSRPTPPGESVPAIPWDALLGAVVLLAVPAEVFSRRMRGRV